MPGVAFLCKSRSGFWKRPSPSGKGIGGEGKTAMTFLMQGVCAMSWPLLLQFLRRWASVKDVQNFLAINGVPDAALLEPWRSKPLKQGRVFAVDQQPIAGRAGLCGCPLEGGVPLQGGCLARA